MTMPNFLIIGAARSGTTTLYRYLEQHPEIYVSPVKEPGFFAFEGLDAGYGRFGKGVCDLAAYRALFDGVAGETAVGEVSPIYLISPRAPARIQHYIPEARLVAILREPAERARSAATVKALYGGAGREAFGQTVRDIHWGFYHAHLRRYFDRFDPAQIRVYLHEDLRDDARGLSQDLYGFLGVNSAFEPDVTTIHNVSGIPRRRLWRALLAVLHSVRGALAPRLPAALRRRGGVYWDGLQRWGLVAPPPLEPEVRAELLAMYRDDILRLQELIGRDLSAWLR
jgi:hypothetical protein